MTFLNWAMLGALAAISIPILIHLLNRQKATVVDWGAMRFLMESLTSRSRKILLEEIILMVLRCLVVALIVMAMARPFLPSRTNIPWALVLPTMLAAVILVGIAAAMWAQRRHRWILLGVAATLAGIAILSAGMENVFQNKQWSLAGGERDVAIVIDGSTSMTIPMEGRTNFQRAVDEARAVVQACRPADAVSLFVAGPLPRPIVSSPTSNRDDVLELLNSLAPTSGSMRVIEGLSGAGASLAEGHNPAKKVVLITDGQKIGWDLTSDARWKFLAEGLKSPSAPPAQVVCRTLPLPSTFRNAAISDVRFSRKIVGVDRPVHIDVTVMNTGTTTLEPMAIDLAVGDASVGRQDAAELAPGASETVRFEYRFEKPGPHVIMAKALCDDEMPGDNIATRVLTVIDRLPVLLVEGDPSALPLDGAASFIEIALTAGQDDDTSANLPRPAPPAPPASGKAPAPAPAKTPAKPSTPLLGSLVAPTVIAAPDIGSVTNFQAYSLVILANASQLPRDTAARLARFVQDGGGLLVVTGDKVLPSFYNGWTTEGGLPFMPAQLGQRRALASAPAHIDIKTCTHASLELLRDPSQSDIDKALVTTVWPLTVSERDKAVLVGGLLTTSEPLIVERQVGKGTVMMTALSLDRRDSNLPSLKCYVPLIHEIAYYLASPAVPQTNVPAGAEFVMRLPATASGSPAKAEQAAKVKADVLTPSNRHIPAEIAVTPGGIRLRFTGTQEPGLYRVTLPVGIDKDFALPTGAAGGIPFAVVGDAEEGQLLPLSDADYDAVGKRISFFRAKTTAEMTAAVTGSVPGEELWKYLAVALLVALLAEIGLARWIASQRRMHVVETVTFGAEAVDAATFRQRARGVLLGTDKEA